MDYTATASDTNLSPSYIAASISGFPWGPGKTSSAAFGDYVTIKLKNTYLITGVQTYKPTYVSQSKEQPDSFMLSYGYDNYAWNAYTGRSKEAVSLLCHLFVLLNTFLIAFRVILLKLLHVMHSISWQCVHFPTENRIDHSLPTERRLSKLTTHYFLTVLSFKINLVGLKFMNTPYTLISF